MHRRLFLAAGASLPFLVAAPALAHRKQQVLTNIVWNSRGTTLEITHIFHSHDAAAALARLGKIRQPDMEPLRARAALALYVHKNFQLRQAETVLPLELVGAETEGSLTYIYQQIEMPNRPDALEVKNEILMAIYSGQVNHVHFDFGGGVVTRRFDKDRTVHIVNLIKNEAQK